MLREEICLNFFSLDDSDRCHCADCCFISTLTYEINVSTPMTIWERNSLTNFNNVTSSCILKSSCETNFTTRGFVVRAPFLIRCLAEADNREAMTIWHHWNLEAEFPTRQLMLLRMHESIIAASCSLYKIGT